MHFAQTDKGKAEAGQRKVSGAVGTGRAGGLSNFFMGRASGTGDAMLKVSRTRNKIFEP